MSAMTRIARDDLASLKGVLVNPEHHAYHLARDLFGFLDIAGAIPRIVAVLTVDTERRSYIVLLYTCSAVRDSTGWVGTWAEATNVTTYANTTAAPIRRMKTNT
jgi:hypothetical protein